MRQARASVYPLLSAGPDWITATAKNGSPSWLAEVLAGRVLDEERASGRDVNAGSRLGYRGYACAGFFFGRRPDSVLTIASGPRCAPLAQHVINVSTNVSRLDLQITLDTSRDAPHLGVMHFNKLKSERVQNHRPGHLQLIYGHPHGESFYLNKRSSDAMGRCYDKASESKSGPPRTIWRYEVEFKRRQASRFANALREELQPSAWTTCQVLRWYTSRHVHPPVETGSLIDYCEPAEDNPRRDLLSWFDQSLSVTIARSIKRFGLERTLRSLHLDQLVHPIAQTKENVHYGNQTVPPDVEATLP